MAAHRKTGGAGGAAERQRGTRMGRARAVGPAGERTKILDHWGPAPAGYKLQLQADNHKSQVRMEDVMLT